MEDDFDIDQLRQKSIRTAASQDEIEGLEDEGPSGGGFLSQYTPGQRLILALLLLIDVVVVIYVLYVIFT